MANETRAQRRARELAELDDRQAPIGFYLLAQSHFEAADRLVAAVNDASSPLSLRFEHPIRHLYAHGWELALKACLFQQGLFPSQFKGAVGHSLLKAWDRIDRPRFRALNLQDELRQVLEVLEQYHGTKLYAYPVTGFRSDLSFVDLRAACRRFDIPRAEIVRLFAMNRSGIDGVTSGD